MKQVWNAKLGTVEWQSIAADDYDFQQEIARSAFADMLHDDDRVEKLSRTSKRLSFLSESNVRARVGESDR